jgi:S-adenosyl methyltransferase
MPDAWGDDKIRRERAELIDTKVPTVARAADYVDGGRDNFEADRKAIRAMTAVAPVVAMIVPALRAFQRRAVRYLVTEAGVRQFLDVGAALPASGLTHEVAQSIDPTCRIVYVSSDPMVLTHARALAKSAPGGIIDYVDALIDDPDAIAAGARAALDLRQPVAVILVSTSMLARIPDTKKAVAAVSGLLAGLPSGSYVALYAQASDIDPRVRAANRRWNQLSPQKTYLRSRDEVASMVAGLELVPPGLVLICDWQPAPDDPSFNEVIPLYGVVARKP